MSAFRHALAVSVIAVSASAVAAQAAVSIRLSPADRVGPAHYLIQPGSDVKLTVLNQVAPAEVHLYAFPPAKSIFEIDPSLLVILHQEIVSAPKPIHVVYTIPEQTAGLAVSLLAVAFDREGNPHLSDLMQVTVADNGE